MILSPHIGSTYDGNHRKTLSASDLGGRTVLDNAKPPIKAATWNLPIASPMNSYGIHLCEKWTTGTRS